MSDKFNYIENIGALTLEQKRKYYVLLAHDLTVSVRAIWSDEKYSDQEKIQGMKIINEIMHRLIFRIEELPNITRLEDDSWTEEDFFIMMKEWVEDNSEVASGNVGWAIKSSYGRCFSV